MENNSQEKLSQIYDSICIDTYFDFNGYQIEFHPNRLEEYSELYDKACFYDYTILFTSSKHIKSYSKRSLSNAGGERVYISYHKDRLKSSSCWNFNMYNVQELRQLFPFVNFIERPSDEPRFFPEFYSEWFDPKLLLLLLPSRRMFIDEVLKDLDNI